MGFIYNWETRNPVNSLQFKFHSANRNNEKICNKNKVGNKTENTTFLKTFLI